MLTKNMPARKVARKYAAEQRQKAPHITSAPDEKHPNGERHSTTSMTAAGILSKFVEEQAKRSKIVRGSATKREVRRSTALVLELEHAH